VPNSFFFVCLVVLQNNSYTNAPGVDIRPFAFGKVKKCFDTRALPRLLVHSWPIKPDQRPASVFGALTDAKNESAVTFSCAIFNSVSHGLAQPGRILT
jgi:hypothetical protein